MICSERELGLTDEHNGIMVLPEDTPLGADINSIAGTGDTIVEFNATPNRPDWLSVIGIAFGCFSNLITFAVTTFERAEIS